MFINYSIDDCLLRYQRHVFFFFLNKLYLLRNNLSSKKKNINFYLYIYIYMSNKIHLKSKKISYI